jgi:predicted nucleotidyltransferase
VSAALREVIEGHYLETREGLFFAVKGLVHPPGRVVACLRYAPDPEGEREVGGLRYRRLYHFPEQEALLREHYPHFLAFDPVWRVNLQSVPHEAVRRIYDPRRRLEELREQPDGDSLAGDCVAFAALLAQQAGIPERAIGVSGSLLIGLQRRGSDLDMTIYGLAEGRAVHAAMHRLLDGREHPQLERLDATGLGGLYDERVADTQMTFADFVAVERTKINQGLFRGRPYFLRFVPGPDEISERYGDFSYEPVGRAAVRATVACADASIYTPCVYAVSDVTWMGGAAAPDLREIVSFRGRFCEQARAGDRVVACGLIEKVQAPSDRPWHRLLLGNAVEDHMILSPTATLPGAPGTPAGAQPGMPGEEDRWASSE